MYCVCVYAAAAGLLVPTPLQLLPSCRLGSHILTTSDSAKDVCNEGEQRYMSFTHAREHASTQINVSLDGMA